MSEDFAKSFEGMMQEAVIESMISDTYAKRLEDWYKNFGEAMKGGLDKNEQAGLKNDWDDIVADALEKGMPDGGYGWDKTHLPPNSPRAARDSKPCPKTPERN